MLGGRKRVWKDFAMLARRARAFFVRDGASGKRANVIERVQRARARAKVALEAPFDRNVENHWFVKGSASARKQIF